MTVEELHELAEHERERQAQLRHRVLYCSAAGCVSCGSLATRDGFKQAFERRGLTASEVVGTGCMGLCGQGPLVKVQGDEVLYERVDAAAADRIVDEHLAGGRPLAEHRLDTTAPFFSSQVKVVLENCGRIDATRIEEYIAVDGYQALARAVTELKPADVVDEVRKSGLRGRGGAGYPPASSGTSRARRRASRSTSSATPTKAIRAPSWIAACSRAIRIASWKAWPLPATASARARATSTCVRSIRWPSNA